MIQFMRLIIGEVGTRKRGGGRGGLELELELGISETPYEHREPSEPDRGLPMRLVTNYPTVY